MSLTATERAPEVVKLIGRVAFKLEQTGKTTRTFVQELNALLPMARRLSSTGRQQASRWLNPQSPRWSEPAGEIVIAMQKWLKS
jgi:hypothetical protein